jgi:hypothetical protein
MPDTTPATKASIDHAEFSATLLDIDRGKVHDDAGELLAQVVEAVNRTGAKGTLTVTIEVEPLDPKTFGETGILALSGSVKPNIPQPKRSPAIFYTNGKRRLTRDDPQRDDPRDRD